MKKALLVLLCLTSRLAFPDCIYCKESHNPQRICLPLAHFRFLRGENSPSLKCAFIKSLFKEFQKQKIKNLQKCKHLQKIFRKYYAWKKNSENVFIPQNVYEGIWLYFFNAYIVKPNEIILFNMALHFYARRLVQKRLVRSSVVLQNDNIE